MRTVLLMSENDTKASSAATASNTPDMMCMVWFMVAMRSSG